MLVLMAGCSGLELSSLGYLWASGFRFRNQASVAEVLKDDWPNNLQPDPRRIWSYLPNTHFTYTDTREQRSFDVRINGMGFRGRAPAEIPAAASKFVALGDSFTFGWLVDEADRWDEVLARLMTERLGETAAPINLGGWMSTFDQHALVLEQYLPLDCRLVIHLVYPSHLQTINRHQVEISDGRIVAVHDPLLHVKDGRLYYGVASNALVSKRLAFPFTACAFEYHKNLSLLRRQAAAGRIPDMTDEQIYERAGQARFANGWRLAELSIRQISETLRKRGVPYVVVLVPRDLQLSAAEWGDRKAIPEILQSDVPQARFREIVARTQWARCLDLLPLMRRHHEKRFYFDADPHWRPEGHAFAAQSILEALVEEGLLDGLRRRVTPDPSR